MDTVLTIKVISALIYPIGLVLVFALLYLLLKLIGKSVLARLSMLVSILSLVFSSNPIFANYLARSLENQYPQKSMEETATHDIIMVLGGGLRLPYPPAINTQLSRGSDRYWYATQLHRAGKAQRILLTGGNVINQEGFDGEAQYAKQLLMDWGVPEEAILTESLSRTTMQNRDNVRQFLTEQQIQSVLLVTSALHMPRAHRIFGELPLVITPASADVLVRDIKVPTIFNWLPSASALALTTYSAHEYYGLWFNQIVKELKVLKPDFWCPSCTTQATNSSPI